MKIPALIIIMWFLVLTGFGQSALKGVVTSKGEPVPFANVLVEGTTHGTSTNEDGEFVLEHPTGKIMLVISGIGYKTLRKEITSTTTNLQLELIESVAELEAVVVTGTMKEVTKMNSPIPVEVFAPSFFLKNPTPNIFEALSLVNGVQPQIN
ncbi:MAG TPA: carboxypeptidase-like regulatory domain-containing protein, partial [Cyclobacteriaceae bacterium]|nr:carboxypeptidase-like regulatory domain-containing protein [Cyclobacteriaceae bacterium]